MPPRYTDEFKLEAARVVRERGCTVKAAARSLGVDPGSIRGWARKLAPATAGPGPGATPEELARENRRLREEVRRLTMEREILPLNAPIALPTFSPESSLMPARA